MTATIYRAVHTRRDGPQTGVYAFMVAPGNCLVGGTAYVTVYPGTVIAFSGMEANDNTIGAVWS